MYLSQLNEHINGIIYQDVMINKIKIDSKEIKKGDLFIAINKGHNYIEDAINNGAVAIISEIELEDIPNIKVKSSVEALGKIAHFIRQKYNIPLIAITGSVGKTTTKELISLVLSKKYKVLKSMENNNNHIGVPKTLLNLDENYDVIVTNNLYKYGKRNGIDVLHDLKAIEDFNTPIIVLTVSTGARDKFIYEDGFDEYMEKVLTQKQAEEVMTKVLSEKKQ